MVRPQQVKIVDSPNERKEVVYLLSKLSPQRRIDFIEWCCHAATLPNTTMKPQVSQKTRELAELARWDSSASERLTVEVYMDVFYLSSQYAFDLERALVKLVEMVRWV